MLCHRFGFQTGVEFRVPRLLRNCRTGLFLGRPKVPEDLTDQLALVDPLDTVGINLSQGLSNGFTRCGHAQGFEGINQVGVVSVSRPVLRGRLLLWPLLPGLAVPSHPVEKHGLAVIADAGLPDFKTLSLRFQVENRTLAGLMQDWFRKDPSSDQRMEPAF